MGRIYTTGFQAVAITAAQDLVAITVPATTAIAIHEVNLTQKTLTAWEAKDITLRRFTSNTGGASGGSTPTATKQDPNGLAALCTTIHVNDTTVQTGANTILRPDSWAFLNGYFYLPPPEDRIIIQPSAWFIVRLDTAPSASMTCSGTVTFEELC